jgi:hypothetical protein
LSIILRLKIVRCSFKALFVGFEVLAGMDVKSFTYLVMPCGQMKIDTCLPDIASQEIEALFLFAFTFMRPNSKPLSHAISSFCAV